MRHSLFVLSLLLASYVSADTVYHSKDRYGRSEFSDTAPNSDFQSKEIVIENDYSWRVPKTNTLRKKTKQKTSKKKRKKNSKSPKKLSFLELKSKCDQARSRYHNYRGKSGNEDWAKYKAKLAKYVEKKNYWCSRYLRRK